MEILLIEDDLETIDYVKKKLEPLNYIIKIGKDAFEGLSLLEDRKFDVIISNIFIPSFSGMNIVSLMKEFSLRKTPVIIISSMNNYFNNYKITEAALQTGIIVDFMLKPINFNRLISICETHQKSQLYLINEHND